MKSSKPIRVVQVKDPRCPDCNSNRLVTLRRCGPKGSIARHPHRAVQAMRPTGPTEHFVSSCHSPLPCPAPASGWGAESFRG